MVELGKARFGAWRSCDVSRGVGRSVVTPGMAGGMGKVPCVSLKVSGVRRDICCCFYDREATPGWDVVRMLLDGS